MKKLVSSLASATLVLTGLVGFVPPAQAAAVTIEATGATLSPSNTSRKMVIGPDGDIFILYSVGATLLVARSTDDGATFSSGVLAANATSGELAISSSGTLYVTYMSGATTIKQRKSTDAGATWSAELIVASGVSGGVGGGGVHTAVDREYVYIIHSSGEKVYSSSDAGVSYRDATVSPKSWAYSDVAIDPLTGRLYVFADDPNVSWFGSVDRGLTFSSERVTGKQVFYSVAAISSNIDQKYLFMAGSGTNLERLNLQTNQVSTSVVVGAGPDRSRSLAADGLGNVVSLVVTASGSLIFEESNDYGATFGAAVHVASGMISSYGSVAINPTNGDILIMWADAGAIYFESFSGLLVGYDLNLNLTAVDFSASGTQPVIVTNVSSSPITVSSVELSNTAFTQSNTCTGLLAPSASCVISITAAASGSALLRVSASGGIERVIPVAFGASSATVAAETLSMTGPATPPYTGPLFDHRPDAVGPGQRVVLTGKNLATVSRVTLAGKDAVVKVLSSESIEITVPADLPDGTYDLVATSSDGVLTAQGLLKLVSDRGLSTARTSVKPSTDGTLKVRVFDPVGSGKVQIFLNGQEVAWINTSNPADPRLTNGYFVRTLKLVEGKNVIEVFVDGVRIKRVAYAR